jgi:hypothetical protein
MTRADEGNRTPNLLITNQLLYQLSYVSAAVKETNFSLTGQVGPDASIIFLPQNEGTPPRYSEP